MKAVVLKGRAGMMAVVLQESSAMMGGAGRIPPNGGI
jgi:hypothetical protein